MTNTKDNSARIAGDDHTIIRILQHIEKRFTPCYIASCPTTRSPKPSVAASARSTESNGDSGGTPAIRNHNKPLEPRWLLGPGLEEVTYAANIMCIAIYLINQHSLSSVSEPSRFLLAPKTASAQCARCLRCSHFSAHRSLYTVGCHALCESQLLPKLA